MEKQRHVTLFYHRGSGSLESMKTEDLSLQMFDDPDHDVRFSLIKARRKAKIESMQNPFILERKKSTATEAFALCQLLQLPRHPSRKKYLLSNQGFRLRIFNMPPP
jgi:hypothetical protein